MLRFLWNGIKGSDNRLQKCHYSDAPLRGHPTGTITIYRKDGRFSAEVREHFTVENDTDIMTDYFEDDRIRVEPSHPLFAPVSAALAAQTQHREARVQRWAAKHGVTAA